MWIELHDSARDHPKLVKVARDLGIPKVYAFGHLCSLWAWALRMAPDGDLSSFDVEDIEIGAEWEGESGRLVSVFAARGLIDATDHGYAIHDWDHYAEHLKAADRKRRERDKKRGQRTPEPDCPDTSRDSQGQTPHVPMASRDSQGQEPVVPACHADRPTDRPTEPTERTGGAPRLWPAAIGSTLDLESAASEWGWAVQLSSTEIGRLSRITRAGPIQPHEYEQAKAKAQAKGSAKRVAYFLGAVEGARGDADEEANRPSPPPKQGEREVVPPCRLPMFPRRKDTQSHG